MDELNQVQELALYLGGVLEKGFLGFEATELLEVLIEVLLEEIEHN
ncbi:hypothetical protein [Thalassolituus oleivorans]|nr:hypothetical protein [Thalassolituus oleivorans]